MPALLIPIVAGVIGYIFGTGQKASVGDASLQLGYAMDDSESTRAALERYANAMAQNNADWFKAHPDAPCCVGCAGVGYIKPPDCKGNRECQAVRDASSLLDAKVGTCIDMAAYDAGHYLSEGQTATVRLYVMEDEEGNVQDFNYHAVVMGPKGLEDPAAEVRAETAGCGCGPE